jgi:hypothetical protein
LRSSFSTSSITLLDEAACGNQATTRSRSSNRNSNRTSDKPNRKGIGLAARQNLRARLAQKLATGVGVLQDQCEITGSSAMVKSSGQSNQNGGNRRQQSIKYSSRPVTAPHSRGSQSSNHDHAYAHAFSHDKAKSKLPLAFFKTLVKSNETYILKYEHI